MEYRIEVLQGYIKATLSDRQTPADTQEVWDAVLENVRQHDVTRVLISVKASEPMFDVEKYGFSALMAQAVVMDRVKIALVSDTQAVANSHAYVESLARQRGVLVKAFRYEQAATAWLIGG